MEFKNPKKEESMTYFVSLFVTMLISEISQMIFWHSYRNIAKHIPRCSTNTI
jgi:hypothetical protein